MNKDIETTEKQIEEILDFIKKNEDASLWDYLAILDQRLTRQLDQEYERMWQQIRMIEHLYLGDNLKFDID